MFMSFFFGGCFKPHVQNGNNDTLRIQVCPKKGISPTILLWGWDWDHQTYSREGYGSLGIIHLFFVCNLLHLREGKANPDPSVHASSDLLTLVIYFAHTIHV